MQAIAHKSQAGDRASSSPEPKAGMLPEATTLNSVWQPLAMRVKRVSESHRAGRISERIRVPPSSYFRPTRNTNRTLSRHKLEG